MHACSATSVCERSTSTRLVALPKTLHTPFLPVMPCLTICIPVYLSLLHLLNWQYQPIFAICVLCAERALPSCCCNMRHTCCTCCYALLLRCPSCTTRLLELHHHLISQRILYAALAVSSHCWQRHNTRCRMTPRAGSSDRGMKQHGSRQSSSEWRCRSKPG